MQPIYLNPDVFTAEERARLQSFIDLGRWQDIGAIIDGGNLTPQKESELERIVETLRPAAEGFVSKFKDEAASLSGDELSPEKAAEIEGKMIKEFQVWKEAREKEKEEKLLRMKVKETEKEVEKLKEEKTSRPEPVLPSERESEIKKPKRGRPPKATV